MFTEEGFDAKAYATKVIEGHAISQQLAVLAEGINLVDKELHKQVMHAQSCCTDFFCYNI